MYYQGGGVRCHRHRPQHWGEGDIHGPDRGDHERQDQQAQKQLPPQGPAWHQTFHPRVEVERQGGTLLGHLADPVQSKQLQPHHGDVPPLLKREVSDHVCPGHGFPQQEDGDLLELQAQGEQAVGESLRPKCCSFFPFRYGKWNGLVFQSDPVLYA